MKWIGLLISASGLLLFSSCSAAVRDQLVQGLNRTLGPVPQVVSDEALADGQASGLMVFGGDSLSYGQYLRGEGAVVLYNTYLGCLSCQEFWPDSLFNDRGRYGSTESEWSIRNSLGVYGRREADDLFSFSACNPAADVPPVIADQTGAVLGVLTINETHPQITPSQGILWENRYWLSGLQKWLVNVCTSP